MFKRGILVWLFALPIALFCSVAGASHPVRSDGHPIGWMHGLNLGTSPGWDKSFWFEQELSLVQVWSIAADYRRKSTGQTLTYQADFEQTSYIANLGFEVAPRMALALEIQSASRGGNVLDKMVDDFHAAFNFYRFQRDYHPQGRSIFRVETDGVSKLAKASHSGIGNTKFHVKFWPYRPKTNCRCGLGLNFEIKLPNDIAENGLTSGHPDYTIAPSLGFPIGKESSFKLSASATYADKNPVFEDWPRNKWLVGAELSFDFDLGKPWGVYFMTSIQSPFMNERDLKLERYYVDDGAQNVYQVSSAWNSLVAWRGRHSLGPRLRFKAGEIALLMTEDWGFGARDPDGSVTYVDNAPDVAFNFFAKLHF